ncbi:DNA sulfur modification protein DndB [Pseudoalteromonas sp. SR41-6]|uniref:DNA sulfur modification protein DndB n=1 Tax=Pseudoalteromonas sp. SR41-6 TaxID=2760948 RepID=UPI001602F492|nr:DNA sulfur modification protein DndB [Pseudoalteromonas sp. SR41-6]MBB1333979.1 DNA sulfur modification protein DndB [Pseudoalteromonas sp. SR41-6]
MFYRVIVNGYLSGKEAALSNGLFGRVESCHNDNFNANDTLFKAKRSNKNFYDQAVISTDEKLKKGQLYPELVYDLYAESKRLENVEHCSIVLRAIAEGKGLDSVNYIIKYTADEFGQHISYDDWMKAYSSDAEILIENEDAVKQEQARLKAQERSNIQSFERDAEEITYSFPAVAGIQAGREYFIAQVPFKYLVKFFSFVDESLPPAERAQRKVNEKHANDIAEYVTNNPTDYVLPSMTVSVDKAMVFDAEVIAGTASRLGLLRISCDSTLLINDGQHRAKSLKTIIKKNKSLQNETIPVTFFYDEGLKRSQQIFADLNNNISKPSAAISSLYDIRNEFNSFVLDLLEQVPLFNQFVDKENTSIHKSSNYIWSLVHFKKFVEALLGKKEKAFNQTEMCQVKRMKFEQAFKVIFDVLRTDSEFTSLFDGDLSAQELKSEYLSGYAVFLESLGHALSEAVSIASLLPGDGVSSVSDIDELFLRSTVIKVMSLDRRLTAPIWIGRCIVAERLVKNVDSVNLTAALFRRETDLKLTDKMIETEMRYKFSVEVNNL